jgi:glycosyltransferase involved in cell wall biosynthesis
MIAEPARRLRLLIVLRSFSAGGAERQMLELLRGMDRGRFEVEVVCFYPGAWHEMAAAIPGVRVSLSEKRGRWDIFGFLGSLLKAASRFKPDVVYGYMFAADLVALLAARRCGARVVFGLRSSDLEFRHYDRFTRFLQWSSRRVARFADLVISNSRAGLDDYLRGGARPRKAVVIPNGVDCQRFRLDTAARAATRATWGLAPDDVVIGLVARIDPMKGHDVFLTAAAEWLRQEPRAQFVFVGGATSQNDRFHRQIREQCTSLGLDGRVHWIGQTAEPEKMFPALDVLTSASRFGEGFSNSVAEAMACGIPCVVTRVGDSAEIVGEVGVAVPREQPGALAAGWREVLGNPHKYTPDAARRRVTSQFSAERMVRATEAALLDIFASGSGFPRL